MTDRDAYETQPSGTLGTSAEADDSPGPATCALPGCDEPLSELPGGLRRQYCSPAHRAAARQLSVQHAWRAGQDPAPAEPAAAWARRTADPDEPQHEDWQEPADWEDEDGGRLRWLTGRRVAAGLAAAGLAGAVVSGVLLTRGTPHPATRPTAAASRPAQPQAGPAQLLAKGSSWAGRAEQALSAVTKQLSALTRAEKSITALPAAQRGRRANALLPRVRRQIATLEHERASLSRGLSAWGLYQRSTLELAGVSGELHYLQGLAPHGRQGHGPTQAGGSITSATRGLAADQQTLTRQVGTLTADVRKTVARPLAAVPAGNLVKQALSVIPTLPVNAPANAPAQPPASAPGPIVTRPAAAPSPSKTRSSSITASPRPRPAASKPASAGHREGGAAQSHQVTPRPVTSILLRPASGLSGLSGRNAILSAAEAAARQAIQNESRTLGPSERRQAALLVQQILQWIRAQYYHG